MERTWRKSKHSHWEGDVSKFPQKFQKMCRVETANNELTKQENSLNFTKR